jgi:Ca2+-transporting ATPase
VKVIRDGIEKMVDIKVFLLLSISICHQFSLTKYIGDIAILEPGEVVPCDGIFISGHNVKCDESGATGESDAINKLNFSEIIKVSDPERAHKDCFINFHNLGKQSS